MGILEDIAKRKREAMLRDGEYFFEHDLFCPYCAYEQQDLWDYSIGEPNGQENEFECQKCQRHFKYKMTVVFSGRVLK